MADGVAGLESPWAIICPSVDTGSPALEPSFSAVWWEMSGSLSGFSEEGDFRDSRGRCGDGRDCSREASAAASSARKYVICGAGGGRKDEAVSSSSAARGRPKLSDGRIVGFAHAADKSAEGGATVRA